MTIPLSAHKFSISTKPVEIYEERIKRKTEPIARDQRKDTK